MESLIFIFIHIHTFRHEGEVLIFILAFQSICGDAAGCGTALLFSTLTCSVLSIALQLFASGGNYTACFSISKLCLFFTPIFHLKVLTDIKDRVSKPQVTSPCVKPPIKNSVAMQRYRLHKTFIQSVLTSCSPSFLTLPPTTHSSLPFYLPSSLTSSLRSRSPFLSLGLGTVE